MSTLDLIAYRGALRTMVGAAWPEVLPASDGGGGIWTVPRVEQTAFGDWVADTLDAGTGSGQVVAAFVQQEVPTRSPDWSGLTNQVYSIETSFHYIMRRDLDTDLEELVEARLLALSQMLLYIGPSIGQCLAVTGIDVGEANDIGRILLEKNMAFYGGTLSATMLVGHDAL